MFGVSRRQKEAAAEQSVSGSEDGDSGYNSENTDEGDEGDEGETGDETDSEEEWRSPRKSRVNSGASSPTKTRFASPASMTAGQPPPIPSRRNIPSPQVQSRASHTAPSPKPLSRIQYAASTPEPSPSHPHRVQTERKYDEPALRATPKDAYSNLSDRDDLDDWQVDDSLQVEEQDRLTDPVHFRIRAAPDDMPSFCIIARVRGTRNDPDEIQGSQQSWAITPQADDKTLTLSYYSDTNPETFTYDAVYSESACQMDIYRIYGIALLRHFISGQNTTFLAYGARDSGKSYTLFGDVLSPADQGIASRAAEDLFAQVQSWNQAASVSFRVRISFLEVQHQELRDLLASGSARSTQDLEIVSRNNDYQVKGLKKFTVRSSKELVKLIGHGIQARNPHGCHALLYFFLEEITTNSAGTKKVLSSTKFTFADLASTDAQGLAGQFDDSLDYLGQYLQSLTSPDTHHSPPVPEVPLTQLLVDSLSPPAKTVMIVCLDPSIDKYWQSANALKFGSKAFNVTHPAHSQRYASLQPTTEYTEENDASAPSSATAQLSFGDMETKFRYYRWRITSDPEETKFVQVALVKFYGHDGQEIVPESVINPGRAFDAPPEHGPECVLDGNLSTTWIDFGSHVILIFDFGDAVHLNNYEWWTAQDENISSSDLSSYIFEGSFDMGKWYVLDDQDKFHSDPVSIPETVDFSTTKVTVPLADPKLSPPVSQCRWYRWTITSGNRACGSLQASAIRFYDEETEVKPFRVINPGRAGNSPANCGPERLLDGDSNTKWVDCRNQSTLIFDFQKQTNISDFEWYTAQDYEGADPHIWTMEGSADGRNWVFVQVQHALPERRTCAGSFRVSDQVRYQRPHEPSDMVEQTSIAQATAEVSKLRSLNQQLSEELGKFKSGTSIVLGTSHSKMEERMQSIRRISQDGSGMSDKMFLAEFEAMYVDYTLANDRIALLDAENAQLRQQLASGNAEWMQQELESLRSELAQLRTQQVVNAPQVAHGFYGQTSQPMLQLNSHLDELQQQLTQMTEKTDGQSKYVASLENEIERVQSERDELQRHLDHEAVAVHDHLVESEKDETIRKLQITVEGLEDEILESRQTFESQLKSLTAQTYEARRVLAAHVHRISSETLSAEVKTQLTSLAAEFAAAVSLNIALKRRNEELESKLSSKMPSDERVVPPNIDLATDNGVEELTKEINACVRYFSDEIDGDAMKEQRDVKLSEGLGILIQKLRKVRTVQADLRAASKSLASLLAEKKSLSAQLAGLRAKKHHITGRETILGDTNPSKDHSAEEMDGFADLWERLHQLRSMETQVMPDQGLLELRLKLACENLVPSLKDSQCNPYVVCHVTQGGTPFFGSFTFVGRTESKVSSQDPEFSAIISLSLSGPTDTRNLEFTVMNALKDGTQEEIGIVSLPILTLLENASLNQFHCPLDSPLKPDQQDALHVFSSTLIVTPVARPIVLRNTMAINISCRSLFFF